MEVDIPIKKGKGVDIISSLPRNVLESILVRLPIRDALRTSVLSRKWRYAWASIPDLVFDEECHRAFKEEPPALIKKKNKRQKEEPISCRLSSIVDHVLFLHSGPIQSFKISHDLHGCKLHVERWVLYLSRNNIKELFLEFRKGVEDAYKVPSCLFSCKELRSLLLHHCILKLPPNFGGFNNLKVLDLQDTHFSEETIHYLVSSCPHLEELILLYDSHLTNIQFHAPKLKYLSVYGVFEHLSLVGCPQLADVEIGLYCIDGIKTNELGETCNLDKVLGCVTSLEKLYLEYFSLRFLAMGTILGRLPKPFEHLMFLCLEMDFRDSKEISSALCLFRSSPKLQTIEIPARTIKDATMLHKAHFWDETSDCVFHQLKMIKVTNLKGKDYEMDFLKFVLANAPLLEAMRIHVNEMDVSVEVKILKTLLWFQRASTSAKIEYMDDDL